MPIRFNLMDGDLEKSAYERERARKVELHLNPDNPHHGIDCICDSCSKYWGQYARGMAEALARQRATEQAIDGGGEGSNTTPDQATDQGEKIVLFTFTEAGDSRSKRDCDSDS